MVVDMAVVDMVVMDVAVVDVDMACGQRGVVVKQAVWLPSSFPLSMRLGVDVAVDVAGIVVVPTVDEVGRRRGR